MYIKYKGQRDKSSISLPTGKYSTNFKVEAEALKAAATEVKNNLPTVHKKIVIFTDALSVLHAVQNPRKKDLNEPTIVLSELSSQADLILQWIPVHCGTYGNEKADRLAKEGGLLGQQDRLVLFSSENLSSSGPSQKRSGNSNIPTTASQTTTTV